MARDETTEGETSAAPIEAETAAAAAELDAERIAAAQQAPTGPPATRADDEVEPPKKIKSRSRFGSAFSLGFSLSWVGFLAKASIGIAIVTTLGAIGLAVLLARGDDPPLASVPGLAGSALAWGGGFMFAVAAAARAFDRDAADGVRFLASSRGVPLGTYAIGRVFGLAVALMLIVGVGSLATGAVCAGVAHASRAGIGRAMASTAAYAIAFALAMAPLAAATLGARARGRGYVILLAILIVPESLQDSLDMIPDRWRGIVGIPSALSALRDSLSGTHIDAPLAAAATAVLLATTIIATLFAVEQAYRASRATEGT